MQQSKEPIFWDQVCKSILSADKEIKFVAIIDNKGRALESRTRDSICFNMPESRREIFFMEYALRQRMREDFDEYFGPVRFTYAEREKEVMLSFPTYGLVTIVSCNKGVNPKSISRKILNILDSQEKLDSIDTGDHIFRIYDDVEREMNEAFEFLKAGLDRNEAVMLLTDELSKDDLRERIKSEWRVDVNALEAKDQIILKTVSEWYHFADSFDAKKMISQWGALTEFMKIRGRIGLRVFEDTSAFFKGGFTEKLVRYESINHKRFEIPLTMICAYKKKDIDSLSLKQYNILRNHHSIS